MLTACPECTLTVSDKALTCPHCGYPLKNISQKSPPRKITPKKHPKLPNGFGQITELKNPNLRNRFRVMISQGKTEYGRPIQKLLKPRAYFPTYKEAYEALLEYNKNPYDLDRTTTVEQLHSLWLESNSKKDYANYKAPWTYCRSIYDLEVRDLRPRHIKSCISDNVPPTIKPNIKIMFNLMLDYAVEYGLVEQNYARSFELSSDINKDIEENKKDHIAFTDDEMTTLWANIDKVPGVDMLIIQSYMGWRPRELCAIRLSDIDLKKNIIVGGSKTAAGKGRVVPIHPAIRPLIEKHIANAKSSGLGYLFVMESLGGKNRIKPKPVSYQKYRTMLLMAIDQLNLNPEHRLHDPRKTFVTMAKKHKLDEYAIKRIVGHRIDDITESVYTDRDPEWLYEEVCKIPMPTKKEDAV